jgi:hypothetical protein
VAGRPLLVQVVHAADRFGGLCSAHAVYTCVACCSLLLTWVAIYMAPIYVSSAAASA